eukprot:scaffold27861_cov15-Prasinocladus_malaysianus.AAC.1
MMPVASAGYANTAHAGDGAGLCACNSPRLEGRGVHRLGHPEGGLDVSAVGKHVPGVDAVKQAESQHLERGGGKHGSSEKTSHLIEGCTGDTTMPEQRQ